MYLFNPSLSLDGNVLWRPLWAQGKFKTWVLVPPPYGIVMGQKCCCEDTSSFPHVSEIKACSR
eukprot:738670-Amphidinium_carterae.1